MNKKDFRKYVSENKELKHWLKENQDWVKANPEIVRSMIRRLPSQSMGTSSYRPSRPRSLSLRKKISMPKLNLGTISQATQQLSKTFGMIENLQTIMNIMKLR